MAHNFDNFSDHRVPSPANSNISHHSDHSQHRVQRRREESSTPRHASVMSSSSLGSPQTPIIGEAVNTAFNKAQHDTAHAIPPELLAQLTQTVTQTVIKQLQENGLDGAAQTASAPLRPQSIHVPPPPQTTLHHPTPQSPSTIASSSSPIVPNRVYTPPSPQKQQDPVPHISPKHSQSGHLPDEPQSPTRDSTTHHDSRQPSSPLSHGSEASDKDYQRPKGPTRLSTDKEETTLERIWGQLFDEEAHPTMRLGQFLRGLAVHLIEDYEPHHSIVVTPDKMAKYYSDMKLPSEAYPWETVFDDEQTSISRMYRDLGCQHHLIQERYHERPVIPGLTPVGFERWVTLLIQAHPQTEFERLQKAVLQMPINNPDDKKERFPKEISRRLFPEHEDTRIRHMIEDSIAEHAAIDIPRRTSHDDLASHSPARPRSRQPSPPHKASVAPENSHKASTAPENPYIPQSHRASVSFAEPTPGSAASSVHMPHTNHLERERKPYSNIPAESGMDETLHPSAPPPNNTIERERKPYTAQPGGGKTYEDEPRVTKPRAESVISNSARPARSDSTASRARPIPINNSGPPRSLDPKPEIHNHRAPSNANVGGRRQRSPSFSRGSTNDFRRSEGDIRGYQPTFEPGSVPRDSGAVFDESDTRRYFDQQAKARAEKARRQAEEDARHYGESPRRDFDRDRYIPRRADHLNDDDYYRAGGRGEKGNGYDYQQPYGGPVYR